MDLQMPRMDGVAATAAIKHRWPEVEVEVVAVTSFVEEAQVRAALEAGASGYLLKDADAPDVATAIRAAMAGQLHLDPAAAKALAAGLRAPRSAADALTTREREVLSLVAAGSRSRGRSPRPPPSMATCRWLPGRPRCGARPLRGREATPRPAHPACPSVRGSPPSSTGWRSDAGKVSVAPASGG
jgi:CheY-like chemotaxis protein